MSSADLALLAWHGLAKRLAGERYPFFPALVPLVVRLLSDGVISQFFPDTSMAMLCLSRSSGFPWVHEELPTFHALPETGAFSVGILARGIDHSLEPRRMDLDHAVEFAGIVCAKRLPAFVGTSQTPESLRVRDETRGPIVVRGARSATWTAREFCVEERGELTGTCALPDSRDVLSLCTLWLEGGSVERLVGAAPTQWTWTKRA